MAIHSSNSSNNGTRHAGLTTSGDHAAQTTPIGCADARTYPGAVAFEGLIPAFHIRLVVPACQAGHEQGMGRLAQRSAGWHRCTLHGVVRVA